MPRVCLWIEDADPLSSCFAPDLLLTPPPTPAVPAGPGQAIANYDSVTDGHKIVEQALKKWGKVDILVNNAGILRDKSFKGMTDAEFDIIQAVRQAHCDCLIIC